MYLLNTSHDNFMGKVKVAIVGVGNCASNFVQGIEYYRNDKSNSVGLMHRVAGGYDIGDMEVVAAFDIAEGKVGQDLSLAIFAPPNCTKTITSVPEMGVIVQKGPVLDGWGPHFEGIVTVSPEPECDIEQVLRDSKADVMVILLPSGSDQACYTYIKAALNLGIGVVNGIPVLASHDPEIVRLAEENKTSIIGDDFKSQLGGTILHHTLMHLFQIRGIEINKSYQINYGGNTDFLNLQTPRGSEKHKSKARGIKAGSDNNFDLSVNVSYIENQDDNKTCRIWIEGQNFSGCPVTFEGKLTVVDSANSSGVLADAIRCIMVAKRMGIYGRLDAPSAYFMKSPYIQMPDELAYKATDEFLMNP
ncbi:inositol-3-phosphate synthase [Paenibacillus tengchongensis]|uniref:inositol-3-phosphate synthase n=1 Tax=Paenibacillus tengchongensis TaxID=2608684 RepID=UPI001C9E8EA8|nr:inositol-3-phosphate synthase [Paenibacillus tengchongensis]